MAAVVDEHRGLWSAAGTVSFLIRERCSQGPVKEQLRKLGEFQAPDRSFQRLVFLAPGNLGGNASERRSDPSGFKTPWPRLVRQLLWCMASAIYMQFQITLHTDTMQVGQEKLQRLCSTHYKAKIFDGFQTDRVLTPPRASNGIDLTAPSTTPGTLVGMPLRTTGRSERLLKIVGSLAPEHHNSEDGSANTRLRCLSTGVSMR